MSKDTIFQKIIDRDIPSTIVYEDDFSIAVLDIAPVHPGHTLVIPKHPYRNLLDMPATEAGRLFETVQKIALAVKNGTQAEGINIIVNNEPAAGQVVFHTHVHIIPRYTADGLKNWPSTKDYDPSDSADIAAKISQEIQE